MTESESTQRGASRARSGHGGSARRTFTGAVALSALLLVLPAALVVLVANDVQADGVNLPGLVLIAVLGLLYAVVLLRAGESGPPLLAGTSTALCVIGSITVILALLYSQLGVMMGGSASYALLVVVLLYTGMQYALARFARALPGAPRRMRSDTGFQVGALLPLMLLIAVSAARSLPRTLHLQKLATFAATRDAARADLFAIHACAAKHRDFDQRHEYPPSLKVLGAEGSNCLTGPVASGERSGWSYEYRVWPADAGAVARGFTVQAGPLVAGRMVPVLAIDEQGLVREGIVEAPVTAKTPRSAPGLEVLLALRDCERSYRDSIGRPPADLATLRAFADSLRRRPAPNACVAVRRLGDSPEWLQYGRTTRPDEWPGRAYVVTWTRAYGGDSSVTAFQAQPATWGKTGIWSYLLLSNGAIHATMERRHADAADPLIPRCEFGEPPAGHVQCVPGSSAPPSARLVVDSVVDADGFTVTLAAASDSSADNRAAGFQYAFICGLGAGGFTRDSTRRCAAPRTGDSLSITARIRNRDLATREYTQRVRVRHQDR